jgi:hypothetical protein
MIVLAGMVWGLAALGPARGQAAFNPVYMLDPFFPRYTATELLFLNDYKGTDPLKDGSWRGFVEWMMTNTPPDRPTPLGPANGSTVTRGVMLQASAFSDQDGNTQAASQWQIASDAGFAALVWDSHGLGPALDWLRCWSAALLPGQTYWWRVRYKDNTGEMTTAWSKWSNEDGGPVWSFRVASSRGALDSDGDGIDDDVERIMGSSPTDPDSVPAKPPSTGAVTATSGTKGRDGSRQLLVDGEPYEIHAVGYQPTPVGQQPGDAGYAPYRRDQYERDLPLLRAMGCNTIRTWGKVDNDDGFLDACWNDGIDPIRVIAGFWVDSSLDLADDTVRQTILDDFRDYVAACKDHPAILMWLPGGEVNYALRSDSVELKAWFTLLNALGWAAFEVEGYTYHPVTTDLAVDVWNGFVYEQDLLPAHVGVVELHTDDAHLTGLDLWGVNSYRGPTFAVPGDGTSLFAEFATRSAKPTWLAEFGIDAWDHLAGAEDQATQAAWEAALWAEIAANSAVCVGGSAMAWSDEWWKNRQTGTAAIHDPGPWPRGDQPDGWTDEEYYGLVSVAPAAGGADAVTPRQAYYAVGQAWGANWPPVCAWGASPVADQWYAGDVRLEASAKDPCGDETVAQVEFEYSLDSTDGTDGTWQDCGPADTSPPFALVWASQPADGVNQEVWVRARAIDTDWGYSEWVTRRIKVDNSTSGVIFDPHPGQVGVPILGSLTITFATVVTKPGGAPLTDADLPALLSFHKGDSAVPFTATVTTEGRGYTVITVTPSSALDGVTRYTLGIVGDLLAADLSPVPHASASFTTTFGPPVSLAFGQQPGGGSAGVAWDRQPFVAICDAQGNTVADSTAPVAVALAGRSGTLAGTLLVNAAGGLAIFTDLWLDKVGDYQLSVASAGLTGATSAEFAVGPGTLDHFQVEGVTSPVAAGTATSPRVTALDAWGNTKTDYVGTVSFSSSDPRASLPRPYSFYAAEQGVHTFGYRVSFGSTGSQWLRVADGAAQGEQSGIVVLNGPPTAPTPVSPADWGWARVVAALQASPFADVNGNHHAASRWQVSTDSGFASLAWDSGESSAATTVSVPAGRLVPGTTYYWRVRYKDDSGDPASCWSAWSDAAAPAWRFVTSYPLPFTDDFSRDLGWSGLAPPGWTRGPATAGGGLYGNPDPGTDHSASADNQVLGFALGADYPEIMPAQEVVSPALDCTGQAVVELSFWRWLGVDGNEWAEAGVYASHDGLDWVPVWQNQATPVSDSEWTLVTYDLTAVAANQPNVFLKFSLGPTYMAFPYCGWNLDDLTVTALTGELARVWLEASATEAMVGTDFTVNLYVQEDSPDAAGFRGGPLDVQFSAAQVGYAGDLDSNVVIQPPFNQYGTSGSLQPGRIDELGGATTASGLGDGSPVLYAVLTFRAAAPGTAVFEAQPGSVGLALGPPVGQIGTWRVDYGPPLAVTVTPYVPPPVVRVALEGPTAAVAPGEAFDVRVWVREDSALAHGFLGGPLDLYFDPSRARYHGVFAPGDVIQAPYSSLSVTNGTLRETRIDELGGVTLASGYGDGEPVLYAVLRFEAIALGSAEFRAAPGESGLAVTQPVGQLRIDQIDYGAPLAVRVTPGGGTDREITVAADPPGSGIVAGGGWYTEGTEVTVSATPQDGYHFVRWTEAGSEVSPDATYVFTATVDRSLTAHFALNRYAVTFQPGSHGSLAGGTPAVVVTVSHGDPAPAAPAVTPTAGWTFTGWSPVLPPTITADAETTAQYSRITHVLTYLADPNGSITGPTPQTVNHGEDGTAVTATPAAGYHFERWSDGRTDNPRRDTAVAASLTVTAEFAVGAVTHTVTFVAGAGGRIVGSTLQTVVHGGDCTAVTAQAAYGYLFERWSDGSTAATLTVTNVIEDRNLVASFRAATAVPPPWTGTFEAVTDAAAVASGKGLWNLSGVYATVAKAQPLVLNLVHDTKGKLTGTASYTPAGAPTLNNIPIKGSVKGAAGSIVVTIALKGADPTKAVSLALTLRLTVDAAARQLAGPMAGSVTINRVATAVSTTEHLAIAAPMDGTWRLQFGLVQGAKSITGTAKLILSNGVDYDYVIKGKIAGQTAALSLAGAPTDPAAKAIKIKTTITPIEGGWARLNTFSAKGYGQSLVW